MSSGFRQIADLALCVALTALAVATIVLGLEGWVRALSVVPLVVFVPGWVLLAALYPAAGTTDDRSFDAAESGLTDPRSRKRGIDGVERVAFSSVASIVLVSLVALAVHFAPVWITVGPVLWGLVGLIGALTLVAFVRRVRLSARDRYVPSLLAPLSHLPVGATDGGIGHSSGRPRGFTLALVIAIAVFASTVGYAAVNPPESEGFTELAVNPDPVTSETRSLYPTSFAPGETRSLPLLLSNHERTAVSYEVVVELQRVEGGGVDPTVVEERELARRTAALSPGETRNVSVSISPSMTGDDLRLAVLAFADGAPENPTVANARQSLTLPVTVGEG